MVHYILFPYIKLTMLMITLINYNFICQSAPFNFPSIAMLPQRQTWCASIVAKATDPYTKPKAQSNNNIVMTCY